MEDEPEIKTKKTNLDIDTTSRNCCTIENVETPKDIDKTEFIIPTNITDMNKIKTILTQNKGDINIKI